MYMRIGRTLGRVDTGLGEVLYTCEGGDYMLQENFRPRTKTEIQRAIEMHCASGTGVSVSKVVKIEESPEFVRHICPNGGIQYLSRDVFTVQVSQYQIEHIPFYFCQYCGKLFIQK